MCCWWFKFQALSCGPPSSTSFVAELFECKMESCVGFQLVPWQITDTQNIVKQHKAMTWHSSSFAGVWPVVFKSLPPRQQIAESNHSE